jgi:hypothetical protein
LPEPGSPIARTTTPFGARCTAAGVAGIVGGSAAATGRVGTCPTPSASANSSPAGSAGRIGMDPLTAAGVKACATACSRPRPPRPRPPRRRRPRPVELLGALSEVAGRASDGRSCDGGSWDCGSSEGCSWELERGARRTGRDSGGSGVGSEISDSISPLSETGSGGCSASKYAGCKGGGAGWSEGSAGFFLRRCKRSRIHLRMYGF